DLHHAETAKAIFENQSIALIVFACLIKIGIEKKTRPIGNLCHPSGNWRAVHMAVEHRHEDRNPLHRFWSKAKLGRRWEISDRAHDPIGGCDDQIFIKWRQADRISEEIGAPSGRDHACPKEKIKKGAKDEGGKGETC